VQATSALLEAPEFELSGHVSHAVAPTTIEYVPTLQFVHGKFPVVTLYLPAPHFPHGPPFGPDEPALQVQATSALLEVPEFELSGHGPHALAPATSEYVPTPQPAHTVATVAPVTVEYLPAPQFVHTVATVAPVTAEYLPAPQFVHVVTPVVILYSPTAHGVHAPPLDPAYPGLQLQAVAAVLPPGEFEFEKGQPVHDVPPVEYVPAPQSKHESNILDPPGLLNPGEQS
jgi:hypothetical protein